MARPQAIMPVSKAADDNLIRIMLYGEPGVGKSVFAGTSPKCLFLVNNAGEVTSPASMGSNADMWLCEGYDDVDEAFEYMRHEGHKTYDWLWFDNLTLFQEQCMDKIMADLVAAKPNRSQWVPDQHEYLVNQNRIGTMIRSLIKLPVNIGFTAHVMRQQDDDGKVLYLPMLQGGQGALSQKVCGYMNLVAFMKAVRKDGATTRSLTLSKNSRYIAKSRFKGVPTTMESPTVPKLQMAVTGSVPRSGTPAKKTTTTTRKRIAS